MSKRYIPIEPISVRDKNGVKYIFNKDHIGRDGTLGYTAEEIADLYKGHKSMFIVHEVDGDKVDDFGPAIERATAAPGEKRTTNSKAAKK